MAGAAGRETGGREGARLFGYPAALVSACAWTIVGTVGWVAAAWLLRALVEARETERRAARLMLEKSQLELRGGTRVTTGRQYRHVVQQLLRA